MVGDGDVGSKWSVNDAGAVKKSVGERSGVDGVIRGNGASPEWSGNDTSTVSSSGAGRAWDDVEGILESGCSSSRWTIGDPGVVRSAVDRRGVD